MSQGLFWVWVGFIFNQFVSFIKSGGLDAGGGVQFPGQKISKKLPCHLSLSLRNSHFPCGMQEMSISHVSKLILVCSCH